MAIDLTQWRLLLAVAERGSLIKAAETLHTDQPALSRSLRRMERQLGAPLFSRSSQGLTVTEFGRRLLEPVRQLIEQADRVEAAARAEARRAGGLLRVGTVDIYPLSAIIVAATRDLEVDDRQVATELVMLPWLAHPRALLERTIDVGFTLTVDGRPHDPRHLRSHSLWQETSWFALISDQHPAAEAEDIDPQQLSELPLHLPDKGNSPDIHDLILESLAETGVVAPRRAVPLDTFADVLAQIAAGDGWTISAGTVPRHVPPGIAARPLRVATLHTVQVAIVWHVNSDTAAVAALQRHFATLHTST